MPLTKQNLRSLCSPAQGFQNAHEAHPGSEVHALLAAYAAGTLPLADLVRDFRARRWPPVPPVCPPVLQPAGPAIYDPNPTYPGRSMTSSSPTTSGSSPTATTRPLPPRPPVRDPSDDDRARP